MADGTNVKPFRDTYSPGGATQFPSQMSESQILSIFVGDVVIESISRFKLIKSLLNPRSQYSEAREEELVRVVHNAIYTALEAHRSYNDSPSSKMYVDRYVGIKPKRRQPPELIQLLPKSEKPANQ